MARESGGRADKDGNEFERLWVVNCALEVVAGRAQSLKWEPPSGEAEGGDLVLTRDGGEELHQCKIGNKSHGKWAVTHLQENEVLRHASSWLTGSTTRQFHFISRDRVAPLDDLAERARRYERDNSGLIQSLSGPDKKALSGLAMAWGRDWTNEADRSRVLDLLRQLHFGNGFWDVDRRMLEALAEGAFIGAGCDIVDRLVSYMIEQLGQAVHADALRSALAASGFAPRDLRHDVRVPAAIERLQGAFVRDLESNLIGGSPIPRIASEEIVELVLRDEASSAVLIVGGAGSGKSAVLLEAARQFRSKGVPFLPVRFDLDRPENDLLAFSEGKLGLPGDPVACLQALAGERRSVLILDQLDAIRWTAAHSAKATQIVRELMERAGGVATMTVLAACRTFDLDDDRRLRALFPAGTPQINVGELPEPVVLDAVNAWGGKSQDLSPRELQLLRNAFTLGLWVAIARGGRAPDRFANRAELLKAFWAEQRQRIREERAVPDAETNALLEKVVAYLDQEGRLDAPRLLLQTHPAASEALLSLGLLQERGSRVRFGHQAHADYLIAHRVVDRIIQEGLTLVDWIERDQSLFRREQVRQVLQMLRDEEPKEYNVAISALLVSTGIRFHLRQLAVQVLRHTVEPTEAEIGIIADVLGSQELRSYLCDHLLADSVPWTQALLRRDLLVQWLGSGDAEDRARSTRVLGSCSAELGDELAPLFEIVRRSPFDTVERDLTGLLPWDGSLDSQLLFAQRLDLVSKLPWFAANQLGHSLEELVKSEPSRVLALVHAAIAGELVRRSQAGKADNSLLPAMNFHELPESWISASVARPAEAFDLFLPLLEEIGRVVSVAPDAEHFPPYDLSKLLKALQECLGEAAGELARTAPDAASRMIDQLAPAPGFDLIAVRAWISLDAQEYADACIGWLLSVPSRLTLSWDARQDGWAAADLISRFAAFCSNALYDRLEATVTSFRCEWELGTVREQLELLRAKPHRYDPLVYGVGLPRNRYGESQQVLLEALPIQRRSKYAALLVACWRAKFGTPSRPKNQGMGGLVVSPIRAAHLMRIPDSQWLSLARGDWSRRKGPAHRQVGPWNMSERSHETFASDFGEATKRDPVRFSMLAFRLEGPAVASYLQATLWALGDSVRPQNAGPTWAPATPAIIDQLASRGEAFDRGVARAFCSTVYRRAKEAWPYSVVQRLACYAKFAADPEGGLLENLAMVALNSVRGGAIYALGKLSLDDPKALDIRREALRAAASDPHPAVRIAAQAAARQLFQAAPAEALAIFLDASAHEDERVLISSECRHFLIGAWRTHLLDLMPLFERMIGSELPAAAQLGAEWATVAWLYEGQLEGFFRRCERGTAAQRLGVVSVVAEMCIEEEDEPSAEARDLLTLYLGDPDPTVSREAAGVFSRKNFLAKAVAPQLAAAYARSAAFVTRPDILIHSLAEDPLQADRFPEAIRVMASRFGELSGPNIPWSLDSELTTLILGLYEGAEEAETRDACLDAFDALLRSSSPRIQRHLDSLESR